jgi:hypothetical protein
MTAGSVERNNERETARWNTATEFCDAPHFGANLDAFISWFDQLSTDGSVVPAHAMKGAYS